MKGLRLFCFTSLVGSVLAIPTTTKCGQVKSRSTSSATSSSSATATSSVASSTPSSTASAPTVNLDYEVHQATLNETGDYYLFSNIPYAQQPVGDLRFELPVAPTGSSSEVNDGAADADPMCMQAYPQWILELQTSGDPVLAAMVEAVLFETAGQTESCLLLDVYVPTEIYDNGLTAEAPVLVWIHGGGFTYGSKTSVGNPSGLVARSKISGGAGSIVVSINYRLGLFGWLAGGGVTPNLGLYDQRMALDWIQTYIARFGGNAADVTVMGESAGASSILHHITSYGGDVTEPLPFKKAIIQSPAFEFNIDHDSTFETTILTAVTQLESLMNTSSTILEQVATALGGAILADLSLTALNDLFDLVDDSVGATWKAINQAVVYGADAGKFNYGVMVDGTYVPKLPQVLLAEGSFDDSITVMTSHTGNESIPFVPTSIATADDVKAYVVQSLPAASNETITDFLENVYPDVMDGTYPWWSEFGRAAQMATDLNFACTTKFIATAKNNETHNYVFSYVPGYHAVDVAYTFFNGDTTTLNTGYAVNATLAFELQDYIMQFVKSGDPNGAATAATFPEYGSEGLALQFTYDGLSVDVDSMNNARCDWIQQAMVDGLLT